ncbi:hypothetical protein ACO2Q8_01215 [Larkinella sp. VNQ87]|uniref:hypothetical protein n=1 Tax=Larkinella sp. VNQ87 TaxID=3400921 RepID=UPI003C07C2F3
MFQGQIRFLGIIFLWITATGWVWAQEKSATMLGLNPSVTVEPFYEKGELDVNILPLVFQKTLTHRFDLRLISVVNLGIRKAGNQISHLGLEAALPIYLTRKPTRSEPTKGFYLAPGLAFTRNRLEAHSNSSLFLEPGYQLLVGPRTSLSFGLQFGRTHFAYDNDTQKWDGHFGFKLIIGRWLGGRPR